MKISVNYFKFKVVTNIKLIQPEEVKIEKYFNFCFSITEFYNQTQFDKIIQKRTFLELNKQLTIAELLSIAVNPEDLFQHAHGGKRMHRMSNISVFALTPSSICYQIRDKHKDDLILITGDYSSKVRLITVSLSNAIPDVDANRFRSFLIFPKEGTSSYIMLTSFDYYISKLKYPYSDNCFNYSDTGYYDRLDAINYCYNNVTGKYVLPNVNIFSSDTQFYNSTVGVHNESAENECREIFFRSDCNRNITYTRSTLTYMDTKGARSVLGGKERSQNPSFVIFSKSRINLVDYVTLVLGTVGTWLGVSFLSLNPIPVLFSTDANNMIKINPINNVRLFREISNMKRDILKCKLASKQTNKILNGILDSKLVSR